MNVGIAVIGEAIGDAFVSGSEGDLRLVVRPGGSPLNTAAGIEKVQFLIRTKSSF